MVRPVTCARRQIVALLVTLALAAGCERVEHGGRAGSASDADVAIDTEVMAFLSMARALHHEANLKEERDLPGAIAALERLTAMKRPHPGRNVPEVEEVLADTYARVAELQVREGDVVSAAAEVREGLTHAPASTYFRGHLLEIGGITEEAHAKVLRAAGQAAEADAAKGQALDFLHQAVLVQEQVVNDSLSDTGKREGGNR
jgi:hypothetical protein